PARERRAGKGDRRDDAVIHGVGEERRAQARRLARAISALDREQRELEGEHEEQQQAEPERGKGSEKGRTQRDRRVGRLAAPPPGVDTQQRPDDEGDNRRHTDERERPGRRLADGVRYGLARKGVGATEIEV